MKEDELRDRLEDLEDTFLFAYDAYQHSFIKSGEMVCFVDDMNDQIITLVEAKIEQAKKEQGEKIEVIKQEIEQLSKKLDDREADLINAKKEVFDWLKDNPKYKLMQKKPNGKYYENLLANDWRSLKSHYLGNKGG